MPDFYKPKHAAPHNSRTDREATALAENHTPRHSTTTRCNVCSGGTDKPCRACVAEAQTILTITRNTGHGINHGTHPADIQGIA